MADAFSPDEKELTVAEWAERCRALEYECERLQQLVSAHAHSSVRTSNIFAGLPVSCVTFDTELQVFEWNPAAAGLWGKFAYQMLLQPVNDVFGSGPGARRLKAACRRAAAGFIVRELEVELTLLDGRVRRTINQIVPLRSARGEVFGAMLTTHDITERATLERRLAHSEERFRLAFESAPEGLVVVDARGRCRHANEKFLSLVNLDRRSLARRQFTSMFHRSDLSMLKHTMRQMLRDEFRSASVDVRMRNGDGSATCQLSLALVFKAEGEPAYWIAQLTDVSPRLHAQEQLSQQLMQVTMFGVEQEMHRAALVEANRRLREMVVSDSLTGLGNRRAFENALAEAMERSRTTGSPLSLLMLDVDNFKLYNDAFGHQAGDVVLVEVARVLQDHCRADDTGARYGGEEFAVILPNCAAEAAYRVAERIRAAIAAREWMNRPVTASVGVATLRDGMSKVDLVRAADLALYNSKRLGRNRCTHANEIEEGPSSPWAA